MNLFCELTCSPHQSEFIKAINITQDTDPGATNKSNVVEVEYYIAETFANGEVCRSSRNCHTPSNVWGHGWPSLNNLCSI